VERGDISAGTVQTLNMDTRDPLAQGEKGEVVAGDTEAGADQGAGMIEETDISVVHWHFVGWVWMLC